MRIPKFKKPKIPKIKKVRSIKAPKVHIKKTKIKVPKGLKMKSVVGGGGIF